MGLYDLAPEESLFALHSFKINQLCKKYKRFTRSWIKNKSCDCISKVRKGEILNCIHLRKAQSKEFEREINELWNLTVDMGKRRLPETMHKEVNKLKNVTLPNGKEK